MMIRSGRRASQTRFVCRLFSSENKRSRVAAAARGRAIRLHGAPKSINAIADGTDPVGNRSVAIRPIGTCRRVFLLNPYLKQEELEGLAYRLTVLKRNRSLSSVLIATDGTDDSDTLPSYLRNMMNDVLPEHMDTMSGLRNFPPAPGKNWFVAGGYDAAAVDKDNAGKVLVGLRDLAVAVRGGDNEEKSKIPVIFVPHGRITDGGSAFLYSSYVMATEQTTFTIHNPARGLALDPTGMSYLLPRVGREFEQVSAQRHHVGCAIMMALMGYEAEYSDLLSTGLVTHVIHSPEDVASLEWHLSQTDSWDAQALIQEPLKYIGGMSNDGLGGGSRDEDHNAAFRNVQVAELVSATSALSAENKDLFSNYHDEQAFDLADPSLDYETWPALTDFGEIQTGLIDRAMTFHSIFNKETSVMGLLENFREIAHSSDTKIEDEVKKMAADFVLRLERASPLALRVTYRLLWEGSQVSETLQTCMDRELTVQHNMMAQPDFKQWQEAHKKSGKKDGMPVEGVKWQHNSVGDVPEDLVSEIFGYAFKGGPSR